MTVAEMIEWLKTQPQEAQVLMHGNGEMYTEHFRPDRHSDCYERTLAGGTKRMFLILGE